MDPTKNSVNTVHNPRRSNQQHAVYEWLELRRLVEIVDNINEQKDVCSCHSFKTCDCLRKKYNFARYPAVKNMHTASRYALVWGIFHRGIVSSIWDRRTDRFQHGIWRKSLAAVKFARKSVWKFRRKDVRSKPSDKAWTSAAKEFWKIACEDMNCTVLRKVHLLRDTRKGHRVYSIYKMRDYPDKIQPVIAEYDPEFKLIKYDGTWDSVHAADKVVKSQIIDEL